MTYLENKKHVKLPGELTSEQQKEQRKTVNRGFRKPEVKGSSPFAGSIF